MPGDTILNPSKAAFISFAGPTTNQEPNDVIQLRNTAATINRGMYGYDLSGLPAGAIVTRAILRLRNRSWAGPGNLTIRVHKLTEAWTESQVTWNNRATATPWTDAGGTYATPSISFTIPNVADGGGVGEMDEVDVTGLVDWSAAPASVDFIVKFDDEAAGVLTTLQFAGNESPTFGQTQLDISYALTGEAASQAHVDWNLDGDFSDPNEDIQRDIKSMAWERGVESELEHVGTGTLELVVRNETGKYSPENTASPLYPNVLPGRSIRIRSVQLGSTYTLFTGYIEKIVPRPRAKEAYILCVDGMDRLARNKINAPSRGIISDVTMGATLQVSGVNITFANANPDTITRASGSFVDDGFLAGMRVRVAGSTLNDSGTGLFPPGFVIATVTALVLTMHADEGLINEGPVAGVTLDGYGPVGIILDEAGWPFAKRSLDQGIDTLDLWWAHKEKPMDAIQKLMDVEKSLAYVNGAGNFVYENRHHRLKGAHLTSQGTFSDTMVEMEYEVSSRPIRNIAVLTGHERTAAAATTRLWGTRDRPRIEQGGVEVIWAHLDNPAQTINVPATDGTDYGISDTSTGADNAALRANVPVIFTKYGQSVKMQFTNNNSQDVYIVPGTTDPDYALYIDGLEYDDDEAFVIEEDADSKTAYGDRSIDVENPFVGRFNPLQAYAEWLVGRFKGINAAGTKVPMPDNVRMHLMNGSSALLTQMLAREISDRITLTVTDLGVTAKEYHINKMRHEVSEGGTLHQTTWWLERADELKYWLLETAGYGEQEETTRVGF